MPVNKSETAKFTNLSTCYWAEWFVVFVVVVVASPGLQERICYKLFFPSFIPLFPKERYFVFTLPSCLSALGEMKSFNLRITFSLEITTCIKTERPCWNTWSLIKCACHPLENYRYNLHFRYKHCIRLEVNIIEIELLLNCLLNGMNTYRTIRVK